MCMCGLFWSLMCFRHLRGIALIILLYSIIVKSTAYTMLIMLRSSNLLSLYSWFNSNNPFSIHWLWISPFYQVLSGSLNIYFPNLLFGKYVCPCVRHKGAKVYPASRRRSNKRVGLKGQLAPHCVPRLKNSIMAYKRLSTSLGSKTLNNTSSLGLGGNQNLRPSCRRPPTRTFHTPVGTLRLDAPALVWVRSPNDGN